MLYQKRRDAHTPICPAFIRWLFGSWESRMSAELAAPHQAVEIADERERFLVDLFDALWVEYRSRVSYVRKYEEVVSSLGGAFFNDHIAFRTLARQRPQVGIFTLSRLFEALGYVPANCYQFPDK